MNLRGIGNIFLVVNCFLIFKFSKCFNYKALGGLTRRFVFTFISCIHIALAIYNKIYTKYGH